MFKVGSPPSASSTISSASSSGSRRAAWMKHLSLWTELAQPFPTHLNSIGNSLSRFDRAFISSPSSVSLKLNIGCSVLGISEETFVKGESDHAPLAVCFGKCFRPPTGDLPIPRWICKHPNFGYHLNSLIDSICILDRSLSTAYYLQKVH